MAIIQLWSGPRWASSSTLLAFADGIIGMSGALRLNQEHELLLTVERSAAWLDDVRPGRHLWMPELIPSQPEWRLLQPDTSLTGPASLRWAGMPAYLGTIGPVTLERGMGEVSNLRGINLSALNYLSTFILPFLQRRTVDWVGIGEAALARQFDAAWEGVTPRQLLDTIAALAEGEWALVPVEGGYLIDLRQQVGADAAEVWLSEGVDLSSLRRSRPTEPVATVARPMGAPSPGVEPSRATIEQNAWRVTGIAGSVVTLAAHRGGRGPILEDDQFAAAIPGVAPYGYGLMWGSTVSEITDSAAPASVTLVSVSGLTVGADVMFVRLDDADDPLALTELPSPSGIAVSGVIVRPFDTDRGGSRNWLANPLLRDGVGPAVGVGRWDAGTGASIDVTGLPASTTYPIGSQVMVTGNGAGGITPTHYLQGSRLSADATSNGSGEATLSLVTALSATASTSLPPVYILPAPALPAGWETVDGGAASARMATAVIRSTARGALSGTTVGAQDYAATAPYIVRRVVMEGLNAGDRIYPGDLIEAASGLGMMVMEEIEVEPDAPSGSPPTLMGEALAYWRFAMWDGTGFAVPDGSGGGNDAFADANFRRVGGMFFPGQVFSPNVVTVLNDPAFQFGASDDYTIVAVIQGPQANPGTNTIVARSRGLGATLLGGFEFTVTGTVVRHTINSDSGVPLTVEASGGDTDASRTIWATRDADTGISCGVVAGASATTTGVRGDLNEEGFDAAQGAMYIGVRPPWQEDSVPNWYRGLVAGVAIFPRVLTAMEIEEAATYISEVASGTVSIAVANPVGTAPNWADGTAVTVTRPNVPWLGEAGVATWVPARDAGNIIRQAMAADLPFIQEGQTIQARAYWALGAWTGGPWTWETGASATTDLHAPVLQLRRTDTDALVGTGGTMDALETSAETWVRVELALTYVVPSPAPPLRLEILVPGGVTTSGGTQRMQVLPIFLGASLDYGDTSLGVIEGAEASDIWQEAQERLRVSRAWSSTYVASRVDIAAAFDMDPASPALELGGEIRLRSPSTGVDEYLRVREIQVADFLAPRGEREETLVLEMDPARITTEAVQRSGAPLYTRTATVNSIASEAPPQTAGAIGASVPTGQAAPTTFDPLTVGVLP